MTRLCFYSVTSLIMHMLWRIHTIDGSAVTSGDLREFQTFFLLISISGLIKTNTQRNSVDTYIKSCLIFQIPKFILSVNIVGYDLGTEVLIICLAVHVKMET